MTSRENERFGSYLKSGQRRSKAGKRARIGTLAALSLFMVSFSLLTGFAFGSGAASPYSSSGQMKTFTIFFENTPDNQLKTSGFSAVQASGMYLPNYVANTPSGTDSLPHYVLAVGGFIGPTDTGCSQAQASTSKSGNPAPARNLFDLVAKAGNSWAEFEESYPQPDGSMNSADTTTGTSTYACKHDFANAFAQTAQAACCGAPGKGIPIYGFNSGVHTGSKNWGALGTMVSSGTLPDVSYMTPDMSDSGHDNCCTFASNFVTAITNLLESGPDYKSGHLAILITWDNGNQMIGNSQEARALLLCTCVKAGSTNTQTWGHLDWLYTNEQLWANGANLGEKDVGSSSMAVLWGGSSSSSTTTTSSTSSVQSSSQTTTTSSSSSVSSTSSSSVSQSSNTVTSSSSVLSSSSSLTSTTGNEGGSSSEQSTIASSSGVITSTTSSATGNAPAVAAPTSTAPPQAFAISVASLVTVIVFAAGQLFVAQVLRRR